MEEAHKRILLESRLEMQEETIKKISLELHDNIGQVASLVKLNLHTLRNELKNPDNLKLNDTIDLAKRLTKDIKILSSNTNTDFLSNLGLLNFFEKEIIRLNNTGLFHAVFEVNGQLTETSSDTQIILIRIFQECINNVIKHSEASEVLVSIVSDNNSLKMTCLDNGVGFDLQRMKPEDFGSGLNNISQRAELLGANLILTSEVNKGTKVIVELTF